VNTFPVGIFDSGVGGLTAMRAVMRLLPGEEIVYFGDTARVPYGTRDTATILRYSREDLHFVLSRGVKAVLVACGTVSTVALPTLKTESPVPICGIVEASAAAAAAATRNGKVAVLGTRATIRSGCFSQVLQRLSPGLEVTGVPCPMFVPLVENGYIQPDNPVTELLVKEYLAPVIASGADTVILGCTHFPLLKAAIGKWIPEVTLIDSGREGARALAALLEENSLLSPRESTCAHRYYVSGSPEDFSSIAAIFLGERFDGCVSAISHRELRLP